MDNCAKSCDLLNRTISEYAGEIKEDFTPVYCKRLKPSAGYPTGKCRLLTKEAHKQYPTSWGRFPLTKKGAYEFCKLFAGNKNQPIDKIMFNGTQNEALQWCYGSR